MNMQSSCLRLPLSLLRTTAILCAIVLLPGDPGLWAIPQQASGGDSQAAPALSNDQLDSLVAPIALYPDQLLAQTLVASTYPLELIQLQQWMAQHKDLKDKALADAVKKQDWDPSIQSMAMFPDVVKQLADNIKWTTDLGNAVLANQPAVMDAVQRMRSKAKDKGNLKSSEQQKVEVQTVESKQVIVIQPSNPEVIYVPSYNPTVVYGAPVYAYPPIYYPPPGYYAAGMAISFGIGMAMGAAWGGGWGYGCGWGGNNNITINNNNNFNRNTNVNGGNRNNINGGNRNQVNPNNRGGNSSWQHNPQHRGGAPYGDRSTANKYGGTARGDSMQSRQNNARQNMQRTSAGTSDRSAGNRGNTAGAGNRGASAGTMDRSSAGNRGASASNRSAAGGDRVGDRSVPSGRSNTAFGSGGGYSGSSARSSSSRGSSSFGGGGGSRSSGGGSRGGGGGRRR